MSHIPSSIQDYEPLDWETAKDSKFKFPYMVRIKTPSDGSCLFHAIINSYFKPYRDNNIEIDGKSYTRKEFIEGARDDLAHHLSLSLLIQVIERVKFHMIY